MSYMSDNGYTFHHLRLGGKYARKHVPLNLRRILSAESAANDGLAFPFLTVALYLTLDSSWRIGVMHWVLIGWLCAFVLCPSTNELPHYVKLGSDQVILGTILGAILGLCLYSALFTVQPASRSYVLAPHEILP